MTEWMNDWINERMNRYDEAFRSPSAKRLRGQCLQASALKGRKVFTFAGGRPSWLSSVTDKLHADSSESSLVGWTLMDLLIQRNEWMQLSKILWISCIELDSNCVLSQGYPWRSTKKGVIVCVCISFSYSYILYNYRWIFISVYYYFTSLNIEYIFISSPIDDGTHQLMNISVMSLQEINVNLAISL